MPWPTWQAAVDWLNDGDFVDAGDDVTSRLLSREGLATKCGRDQSRSLAPPAPGEASLALNNTSRDYSPENASSPLAGHMGPGRPLRITATYSGTTYYLYRGFLDGFDVLPNRPEKAVKLSAIDALSRLAGVTLSTQLYQSLTTGQAIGHVLDAAGWPGGARDLDTGATACRWWWEEGTDALEAIKKLVASEGPPAICYVDYATGNFVFRDRHHRVIRAASVSSQATFTSAGAEPRYSMPLSYDAGWSGIVNSVAADVTERMPEGELSLVWEDSAETAGSAEQTIRRTYTIPAGGHIDVTAKANEPFTGALTPVVNDNYLLLSGSVSVSLDRTSGQSATITVSSAGGARIANLSLSAYSVPVAKTVTVSDQDATSVTLNGTRSLTSGQPVWANENDAAAIADLILAQRAVRAPVLQMRVVNANGTRLAQQLTRALSDRVTVVDSELGLNADFYVEQVAHAASQGGRVVATTFGLEKMPATILNNPATVFKFDHATLGKFDTGGVFAY